MRVVEPKRNSPTASKRRFTRKQRALIWLLLIMLGLFGYIQLKDSPSATTSSGEQAKPASSPSEVTDLPEEEVAISGELRQFKGNEFRLLYDNLLQPNLDRVDLPPIITGNDIADARIRQIAEARGYKLRSSPVEALTSVDGYPVQAPVAPAWRMLKSAAAADGYSMSIVSAYRSVDTQRQLFLSRLAALGVSQQQVIDGEVDAAINTILITTSIPGYSKHHTGYTLDLTCAGYVFEQFKQSPCYGWMSANNYENAKRYGFIPSYPSDADLQGPDPEAWEYVWVGTDLLFVE